MRYPEMTYPCPTILLQRRESSVVRRFLSTHSFKGLGVVVVLLSSLCHVCSALKAATSSQPIRIGATKTVIQPVTVPPCGSCPLHEYMQLPAAQYACVPMPLNSSLTRIEGSRDEFCLEVPKMRFRVPGVEVVHVLPRVMARVSVMKDEVSVHSDACTIRGSPVIENLRLNDHFVFACTTCLTWDPKIKDKDAATRVDTKQKQNVICATTEINVDFHPPGIFARVPRRLQRGVGNFAMYLALKSLLTKFMRSLGGDYERWSTDFDYRKQRQQMEIDLEEELRLFPNEKRYQRNDDVATTNTRRRRVMFW